jgi:transcriptional antiterminator RfaH
MSRDWEKPIYREPHWFCLRTGPKQELRVLRQVAVVEGVEAYCPLVAYRKLRAGHPLRVEEAMFPRYVFARFGLLEQGRFLLSLIGVKGLVEFGGKPAIVDEGIIQALRELTAGEPVIEVRQEISPGRRAVILQGAYAGLEVLVTRVLSAGERVAVLLEVLGAEREVEIQREALLPPAEHPLANSSRS